MSRFLLEVLFSLVALGGLIMLVWGIRMKADAAAAPGGGEDIVLDFSGRTGEGQGVFDLEMGRESLGHGEKRAFDPATHRPEPIGDGKKG